MKLLVNANYCSGRCDSTTYVYEDSYKFNTPIRCVKCGNLYREGNAFSDNMVKIVVADYVYNFIRSIL